MKWLKNFSFKKLFSSKKFAVSFSIVVSFIFWLIIVIDQNPSQERPLYNVPVSITAEGTELENLNMDVISKNIGDTVTVNVSGPSYVVSSLKPDDLLVTVDLKTIDKPGEYVLNLMLQKLSGKKEYEWTIDPATVTIVVDKIVEQKMDVEIVAPGITLDLDSDPNLSLLPFDVKDQITVTGPQSEISKLAAVKAECKEVAKLSSSKTFTGNIKLYDVNGKEMSYDSFTLSYETVDFTAKVMKHKTVPLKAVFIGMPADVGNLPYTITLKSGEKITEVDVQGEPEAINALSFVELGSINFSDVTTSKNSFEVPLSLPTNGVELTDPIETVVVKFDVSGYSQKSLGQIKINVSNAPTGLTIDRDSLKIVNFMVPKSSARNFDASDITASVDLTGKVAGDSVAVTIASKIKGVWAYGTYNVTVKSK